MGSSFLPRTVIASLCHKTVCFACMNVCSAPIFFRAKAHRTHKSCHSQCHKKVATIYLLHFKSELDALKSKVGLLNVLQVCIVIMHIVIVRNKRPQCLAQLGKIMIDKKLGNYKIFQGRKYPVFHIDLRQECKNELSRLTH